MTEYRTHSDSDPQGRHARQQRVNDYRRPQQGAYRPVQPVHARTGGPGGGNGGGKARKGTAWRIVFWVALAILAIALVALAAIGFSYWQGQKAYDDIAGEAFEIPADIEATELADMKVDWDSLRAINPDTVGWIYIPGTVVNYPIVHTTDDERYLKHDFQGSEGWIATFGAIFLSAANSPDFSDANNLVYGHHLNNGSMFAALADFDDETQFNEHRTVYLLTPGGNYRLSSFSLVHCAANDPLAQTTFADDAERTAYVQDKIDRSVVVPDGDVPEAADVDRTFAFITCDSAPDNGRYVLFCSVEDSSPGSANASDDGEDVSVNPDDVTAIEDAAKELA